jgi:hypothetical protein
MSLVLYAATALALLFLANKFIAPIPRVAMVVLAALPFVFVGKALLTNGVFAPVDLPYITEPLRDMREPLGVPRPHNGFISDLYAQMIPWRKAVQFALQHRQWPIWNPFMLSGDLLAASAQPAAYSPFTLLACLLPIAQGLTFSAAITFFLAGLTSFLFLRELGVRDSVALFGGAAWMYIKAIAFYVLWAMGASWAFFPLILLGTRRVVREPSVRNAAILTSGLVLFLLAGHPESVLHAVFAGAIYGLFELARTRRNFGRVLLAAAGSGVVALALCAIYILPILEAAPQTMEHGFRTGAWRQMSHGVALRESGARILTDVFPFLHFGEWRIEGVKYLPPDTAAAGSLVLALAVFAIARIRSAESWFWSAMALFGLLARAAWSPLMNALSKLPLLDVTINERFSFAAAFALVVLAALALERMLARNEQRALMITLAIVFIALSLGGAWVRHARLVADAFPEWGAYSAFAEIAALAAATLVLLFAKPRALIPLLTLVLLGQHFLEEGDIYPTLPSFAAYPPIPILQPAQAVKTPFRIVGHAHGFIPGTSALYELEDVRGYEALTFARYFETYRFWCLHQPVWFNRVDDLTKPFLSFLNVRFAICSPKMPPLDGWHVVAKQRGAELLENERVIERAFIPRNVRVGLPAVDAENEMADVKDFRERAWLEVELPPQDIVNGRGALSFRRSGNGFRITADMESNGWIVVSEPAWKGWRAYIDDNRVKTSIANVAFLGIHVPAGHHIVRLVYLPRAFVVGRVITFVTLLGLLVAGFGLRVARKRAARLATRNP